MALTNADVLVTGTGADAIKATITLSEDTLEAVNAVEGELSLVAAKESFAVGTVVTEGQTVAVAKVTPAKISSAAYNEETNTVTLNFDQAVTIDPTKLGNIVISDETATATLASAKVKGSTADFPAVANQTAKATWEIVLADGQASALEATTKADKVKVYITADDVVKNAAKTGNALNAYANGTAVVYTADETKPTVVSASYTNLAGEEALTLQLSEKAKIAVGTVISVQTSATSKVDITVTTNLLTTDKDNKIVIDTKTGDTKLTAQNVTALEAFYQSGKAINVVIDADKITDDNGLTNVKSSTVVDYKDYVKPELATANTKALSSTVLKVAFNEKVDKATAEAAANYVITDSKDAKLSVTSAELQSDGKTVYVYTVAQEAGAPYELVVSNVKDAQGNTIVANTAAPVKFTGSAEVVDAGLELKSLVASSKPNAKNDTLTLTFNTPVKEATAKVLSNYTLLEASSAGASPTEPEWEAAKTASLSDATVKVDGVTVTITLGATNLQDGKVYKLVANGVTDIYGNTFAEDKNVATSAKLAVAAVANPNILLSDVKEKAITLTFAEELVAAQAQNPANWTIKVGGTAVNATKATYAWDATTGKATVVIDLATALTGTPTIETTKVTNLAGKVVTVDTTGAVVADVTKPTVKSVEAYPAETGAGQGVGTGVSYIKAVFSEGVQTTTAANYEVKINGVAIATDKPVTDFTKTKTTVDNDTVTLTLNSAYQLKQGDVVEVTFKDIDDAKFNTIETVTVSDTVDTGDKIAPKSTTPITTADASTSVVVVTFNEALDATTVSKEDFTVVDQFGNTYIVNKATAADEVVTLNLATALPADVAAHTLTVKANANTSIADLAGNVTTTFEDIIKAATTVKVLGSTGTAGDKKITVTNDKVYSVVTGGQTKYVKADGTLSDVATEAAKLTGTEITGLTNGVAYQVNDITAP